MKKILYVILTLALLSGCATQPEAEVDTTRKIPTFANAEEVKTFLIEGNELYQSASENSGDVSLALREDTTENGQAPYAVVVTCSDSRVVPEHIFNTGLGELFTIRNAGNVVTEIELGSIEYAADHLGSQLVVILGHENCGAVAATMDGHAEGYIHYIVDEVAEGIVGCETATEAEIANVYHSLEACEQSEILQELVASGAIEIVGAIYNTADGSVSFLD